MLRRRGNHEVVKCTRHNVGKSDKVSDDVFHRRVHPYEAPWSRKLAGRRSHKEYTPNVMAGGTQHACHTG